MKLVIYSFVLTLLSCSGSRIEKNLDTNNLNSDSFTNVDEILNYYQDNTPEKELYKHQLIDLNYDKHEDVVLYFRGNGTGILTLIKVYLFDSKSKLFTFDAHLSNFENPSFYIDSLMITSFYIGHGGGYGVRYRWNNTYWDTAQYITFEPDSVLPKWSVNVHDYECKQKKVFQTANFMLPDKEILPNKYQ